MKSGDKVKMWIDNSKFKGGEDYYAYGEITIVSERGIKVIFIEDLNYTYYNEKDLEVVTEEEYLEHERTQSERNG